MSPAGRWQHWPFPEHLVQRWEHAGIDCAIVPGPYSWNGYVRLPRGHPWRRRDYDQIPAQVHGGLTFGHHAAAELEDLGIRRAEVTTLQTGGWVGFDTLHAGDFWPDHEVDVLAIDERARQVWKGLRELAAEHGWSTTWSRGMVHTETEWLAFQVALVPPERPVTRARRQRLASQLRARERRRRRKARSHA